MASENCVRADPATSFPSDQPIHVVAHLRRRLQAGEVWHIALTETSTGALVDSLDRPSEEAADCVLLDLPASLLPAGMYRVGVDVGTERLSEREFEVVADPR